MGLFKRLFGREDAGWQSATPSGTRVDTPIVQTHAQNVVLTGDEARQALEGIEQATGMDLDGDGKIAGGQAAAPGATPPTGAAFGAPDVVGQLERLAKLRESGALTEEEFAREKARLLGGPGG